MEVADAPRGELEIAADPARQGRRGALQRGARHLDGARGERDAVEAPRVREERRVAPAAHVVDDLPHAALDGRAGAAAARLEQRQAARERGAAPPARP